MLVQLAKYFYYSAFDLLLLGELSFSENLCFTCSADKLYRTWEQPNHTSVQQIVQRENKQTAEYSIKAAEKVCIKKCTIR